MEPPPQQEEVGDTHEGGRPGGRRHQMHQDGQVLGGESHMRPVGVVEDVPGVDRQERQVTSMEDRQGGT